MNPSTEEEALALASGLSKKLGEETCPMDEENEFCTEVVVFPPHPFISKVKNVVEDAGITVGAQSIYFEDKGAYTGSVSASMVLSLGCEYVLCGHSERRTLFDDDDQAIVIFSHCYDPEPPPPPLDIDIDSHCGLVGRVPKFCL